MNNIVVLASAIIIVLAFIACNTVCDDSDLRILATKTNYKNKISHGIEITFNNNKYEYEIGDTLELQCGWSDSVYLEWTDEKHNVSQRSCSETKDLTLKLENLGEDYSDNIFKCNSTNKYNTVRLVLKNRTDSSKIIQDNNNGNKICYEIVRENNKNCSQQLPKEVIIRRKIPCSTEITELSNDQETIIKTDVAGMSAKPYGYSGNSRTLLYYAGVVVLMIILLAIITFCILKCYKKVKARTNDEHIYAEPNAVEYAELQIISTNPPTLPDRNEPAYAEIIGTMCPARASSP